jgi:hypothetical protein
MPVLGLDLRIVAAIRVFSRAAWMAGANPAMIAQPLRKQARQAGEVVK